MCSRIANIQPLSNDFDVRGVLACFASPHRLNCMVSVLVERADLLVEYLVEILMDFKRGGQRRSLDMVVQCNVSNKNQQVIKDLSKICSDPRVHG